LLIALGLQVLLHELGIVHLSWLRHQLFWRVLKLLVVLEFIQISQIERSGHLLLLLRLLSVRISHQDALTGGKLIQAKLLHLLLGNLAE
jgi:hypothetical protein